MFRIKTMHGSMTTDGARSKATHRVAMLMTAPTGERDFLISPGFRIAVISCSRSQPARLSCIEQPHRWQKGISFVSKLNLLPRLLLTGVLLILFRGYLAAQAQQPDVTTKPEPVTQLDPCGKSTCRDVPVRDTLDTFDLPRRRFDVKYRAILGGFSQGAGIGGGFQATTADTIKHVQVRANFLTSTGRAQRVDVGARFDDNSNKNHIDTWFSYLKRQTDFFGIGSQLSGDDVRSTFALDQRSYQFSLYRDIASHLQTGFYVQATGTRTTPGRNTKIAPITDRFSPDPNAPPALWIPGFNATTQILSYGGFVKYDARDRSKGLTQGLNIYLRGASNDGMHAGTTFGDFGWIEGEFDVRAYIPLLTPRISLALRNAGQFKNPKGNSQIPFFALSFLGGHDYVRGYDAYRFRGNNVLIYSSELRYNVFHKTDAKGWDVIGFADTGRVWGDSRSLTDPAILSNQGFGSGPWRTGFGGGMEYRHSQGLALRAEMGRSSQGTLIYTALSRGF